MEIQLSSATEADRELARDVHHQAYKDMVLRQFGNWHGAIQDEYFDEAWKYRPHSIIYCEGRACGFCVIEETLDTVHILELAILPDMQRRGIGSHLIRSLIRDGKDSGRFIELNVMKTNAGAKRLYERLGFEVFDENKTHFLRRHGGENSHEMRAR